VNFPEMLRLIDERSATFRATVAAAPDLGVPVPTCPDWTLDDLAQHLGEGQRRWAATVAAGPATAKATVDATAPQDREAVPAWLAASAQELLDAVREAGPDRDCWTWWPQSASPQTAGGAARHQLQEVAVHTYDAQLAVGAAQPLPEAIALDGVDEFLSTSCAGSYRWPHGPTTVDYHATEGSFWRLALAADGVQLIRGALPGQADATVTGTASDLVLLLNGRIPLDAVKTDGNRHLFDLLIEWDPED
jgi:uncharacterized protein (TIGR03083 family)